MCECVASQSRNAEGTIQPDISKSYCTYNHVKVHCISSEAKIGYRCVICGMVVSAFTWIVSGSVAIETLDFHSKTGRQCSLRTVMHKRVDADGVHVYARSPSNPPALSPDMVCSCSAPVSRPTLAWPPQAQQQVVVMHSGFSNPPPPPTRSLLS